ncbi:MAG: efflux RND transporter periplasmic adaptor subunit [Agriterribacter sp.]
MQQLFLKLKGKPGMDVVRIVAALFFTIIIALLLSNCNTTSGKTAEQAPPPPALPVITLSAQPATTYQEFSASLEGRNDIEIRPQVDGYIEKIFVDEGAHVKKGQKLFKINDRIYLEQFNNAKASVAAAKASLASASINVEKLQPLVEAKVVSEVQLKTANNSYAAAAATLQQAEAMLHHAEINLGYTSITAPVDGYIGRIPFKTGSLVGLSTAQPLTVLSETDQVYAYFSLSENDFLRVKEKYNGASIEEKIKQFPPVELILADNSVYAQKGKVEIVSGQFDNSMGAITFRAAFPNKEGLLRSGNTGRLRIPEQSSDALVVPQDATFELQDKIFVFAVSDSNTVTGMPIQVSGKTGNYYLVSKGMKPGQRIVFAGLDRLRDGVLIQPQPLSIDSLFKVRPI